MRKGRRLQPAASVLVGLLIVFVGLLSAGPALANASEVTGAADKLRTGWYSDEPLLTPALLSSGNFQQDFKDSLKGQIYAQPLVADGTLLVVTEDDWAYGLDPITGAVRWEKQVGTPVSAGAEPSDTIQCTDLKPHVGITGTPVIDTEHNVAYFTSNQYVSGSSGEIGWYMNAIELSTGNEVSGFPVKIEGEATNFASEHVKFEPVQELQRPALLMLEGVVYAGFGSHCDNTPFEGWIVGVSTSSGKVVTKWATSAVHGGSIWQSGGGLVSDGPKQILFATGNDTGTPGEWDPPKGPGHAPPEGKLGESVVRVEVKPGGELEPKDFFSPFNNAALDVEDVDLGSSAPVALPPSFGEGTSAPNLLVQEGKSGKVYLLNRDELGGMGQSPSGEDEIVQTIGSYGNVWGTAAVWPGGGGYVYVPSISRPEIAELGGSLRAFKYGVENDKPKLSLAATAHGEMLFGSGAPIVTSNGTTSGSGIVWIPWCPTTEKECKGAELRAYDATPTGTEQEPIWQMPIGRASKFSRAGVAENHIYVGNSEGDLYGLGRPKSLEEREAHEKAEREAKEKEAREATERADREAREKTEREAKEKAEREAAEKAKSNMIATGLGSALGNSSLDLMPEPAPSLTQLKSRVLTSRHGSHRLRLRVRYALSTKGAVAIVVFRQARARNCRRGASVCVHWTPTKIKLRATGSAGNNVLTLNLGRLPAGDYRLAATPKASSGASGATQYARFHTSG